MSTDFTIDRDTRDVIVYEMHRRQMQGVYKGFDEHTLDFDTCDDETLIYYREEWLMSELDMSDEEDRYLAISYYNDEAEFEAEHPLSFYL